MKRATRGLSIFGRTFLLMIAALVIAEGIGLTLLVSRPPMHNAPVRLSDLARQLSAVPGAGSELRPASDEGFDGPGAYGSAGERRGPPPGGGGPPGTLRLRTEWRTREAPMAPVAGAGTDAAGSSQLQTLLAQRLGVSRERVRVFVAQKHGVDAPSDARWDTDPQLREGYVAAWQLDSGSWRIVESVMQGFPNEFQRQALWLFGLGLALLVPLAGLFARALSAPIREFARAAKRLGTDSNAPPLQREGPAEMLAAVDSFNAMQSRLNRLAQERAQMMGAIAHDLRTPLTRLAFRLDDLHSPLKEKVEADIQEMKRMISAALEFLRDRSLGGQREHLDLCALVESVVDDYADVGQDVQFAPGGPVTIEGDPVALRRMIGNLIDNALKYGVRARLAVRSESATARLEVDDDGPGIPEALQQRVFEPFFRAEASRNRDTGGIGLGLASVRAIVLDHGGEVALRNRRERGLRFEVTLPLPQA